MIFKLRHTYKDKLGNDKVDIRFYLLHNGNVIRIAPYFYIDKKDDTKSWNTFKQLDVIAIPVESIDEILNYGK